MKYILSFLLYSVTICCSCNTSQTASKDNPEKSITGINWNLRKIILPAGDMAISNNNSFIRFDEEKKSAGGKGGCNSFGSSYSMNGTSVNFKNIFSTKMFCEEFQKQENNFFMQLEKTNRYELSDGMLRLYKDNELLLEFSK